MPKTHSKVKGLSVSHRTAHRGDRTLASVCTPTVSGALVGEGGEVARVEELVALSGQYLAQGASFCGASAEDEVAPPASGMREIRRPVSGFARPASASGISLLLANATCGWLGIRLGSLGLLRSSHAHSFRNVRLPSGRGVASSLRGESCFTADR